MENELLLSVNNISKKFPGVQALENINFNVNKGEVIGLIGENGAGKSTLIKIISGAIKQDNGSIEFKGKFFKPESPQDAQALGISTIHQELSLVPGISVARNLFLGYEPRLSFPSFFIDNKKIKQGAVRILEEMMVKDIDVSKQVKKYSLACQQMVEISRAVSRNASIILMDEPTSSLSENDVRKLFEIIARLKKRGVSIIFVSHKIPEVVKISDRIKVLRDGQVSGSLSRQEYSEEKIIQLMVGRDVKLFPKWKANIGATIFEAKNLFNKDFIKDISFSIRKGEIVGLAGLVGSGRSELAHLLIGADKKTSGQLFIDGQFANIGNPLEAINHGIALVPEDRKSQGLVMLMNIKKNITLPIINRISGFFRIIRNKVQTEIANSYIHSLSIQTPSLEKIVSTLSGGNQQKVVLSKWLSTKPKLLILDEPTRGIDIGAKAEVHKVMKKLAGEGMGILMISSEMPEILGMSDRVIVMCQGRITGELTHAQASEEKIMALATSFSG